MTRRRDLEHHRDSLAEIGEILASMKTLSYMETRKLARFLAAQRKVVESIREVADDFLGFHPGLPTAMRDAPPVFLVVGTERGFCGDFNRALIRRLGDLRRRHQRNKPRVIAVGHKLHALLEDDPDVAAFIDGASVAEEVPLVLQSLVDELNAMQSGFAGIALYGIYCDSAGVAETALLPPFEERSEQTSAYAFPPDLNVSAVDFLRDLVDHYLYSALNDMLYTSLMSENQRRVSHLDRAVRHIENESSELTRKCKALRQEEITEEIEVILLSATGLNGSAEFE